jgi:tripartite-type tricarboxylate transporter receptor subunit TctC
MFKTLEERARKIAKLGATTLIAFGSFTVALPSQAAGYPDRPVEVVIPNPPGGGTDTLGRLVMNATAKSTGWNLVAVNRPGAAGAIGLESVARSKPDGYTIAFGETSNLAINPSLYKKLSYNPSDDFSPVLLIGTVPLVMVVPADSPYKTAQEFIAAAKQKEIPLGSAGNGTVGHLSGAMLEQASQIKMLHVPYKGAAAVLNDLMGGRVSVFFGSYPSVRPLVESGKLRALAVTSSERTPLMPDVPTLAESGLKDFNAVVWYGLVAPADTSSDQINTLAKAFSGAVSSPEMRERMKVDGIALDIRSGDDFKKFIVEEQKKWGAVVKSANAQVD